MKVIADAIDPGNPGKRNDNEPGYLERMAAGVAALSPGTPGPTFADLQVVSDKADAAMSKATTALADGLTSADRQQAVRVQLTPDANGRAVFVFPKAYATGIKPAVTTTAETPNGVAYRNDASVEEGSASNTQVVVLVQRIPKTLVVNLLGAVLNVLSPVTTPVWINILVRAPL